MGMMIVVFEERNREKYIWGTCIYEFKGEGGRDWEERRVEKKQQGKGEERTIRMGMRRSYGNEGKLIPCEFKGTRGKQEKNCKECKQEKILGIENESDFFFFFVQ